MPAKVDDSVKQRASTMIARGLPLQQISDQLGVSVSWLTKFKAAEAGGGGAAPAPKRGRPAKANPPPVQLDSAAGLVDQLLSGASVGGLRAYVKGLYAQKADIEIRIARAERVLSVVEPEMTAPYRANGDGLSAEERTGQLFPSAPEGAEPPDMPL